MRTTVIYFWLIGPFASQAQTITSACQVQTQPSASSQKLSLAHCHWRLKCRWWVECNFTFTGIPRQVTFLIFFFFLLWLSSFLAVCLASSCSAVGLCQRSHWKVALSCLVGCASPALMKPHKCAVWFHFPCISRVEIFLAETFHSNLHSGAQMLYSEHECNLQVP